MNDLPPASPSPARSRLASINWRWLVLGAVGALLLSFALAWVSNAQPGASTAHTLQGWPSFLVMIVLSGGLMAGVWRLLRREAPPRWLGWLVLGAALLRLALGVVWYIGMPTWGHGSESERAGYIMADAAQRDQAAWKLAQSNKSLLTAFGGAGYRKADQYGGLLFLSALYYRSLGGASHQPLQLVVFTSAFSALAVLFTWALARRAWDAHIAGLAAWLLALYPEALLLGSSQMREAFTITLTAAAFYGLLRYQQERSLAGLGWMLLPLALYLPLSPPFAALLLGLLLLAAVISTPGLVGRALGQRRLWPIYGGLALIVLLGLWLALRQFAPPEMNNPLAMLSWWVRKSADLQAYLSQNASGWLQKVFKASPSWTHLPLLLGYGVMQPFLPAALLVGSKAAIWPWITLWRAAGWTLLLPLLLYTPFLALRQPKGTPGKHFTLALNLVVWLAILTASWRGGADLWDNPRYRQAFAALQIALAAWAWIEHRRMGDPWLRRTLLAVAAVLAWFLPWYARRYFPFFTWPVADLFKTLGLGAATAILLVAWDWAKETKPGKKERS